MLNALPGFGLVIVTVVLMVLHTWRYRR